MKHYHASDDVTFEHYEAEDMDDAVRIARGSWDGAEPGTYRVTVEEYPSMCEDRIPQERTDVRTITVVVE